MASSRWPALLFCAGWLRGSAAAQGSRCSMHGAATSMVSCSLENLVRRIEAVGTLEGDRVELEGRHCAFDRLGLVEQRVDRRLHGGIALGIALGDLLVVGLAGLGALLDRLHLLDRNV